MTVRELTKMLSQMPEEYQNLNIINSNYYILEGNWKLLEDFPLGDYANPECKYGNFIYLE
jgi:hypothetical protein